MKTTRGVEGPKGGDLGVLEGGKAVRWIPAPFRIGTGITIVVERNWMDATGNDVSGVSAPSFNERAKPMTPVMEVIVGSGNKGVGPFTERGDELSGGT